MCVKDVRVVSGNDVAIYIDGKKLIQAAEVQLKCTTELYPVRACFQSDDQAILKKKRTYKLNLMGVRFLRPFECCNFYDLDNFEVKLKIDGVSYTLKHCVWSDYRFGTEQKKFREFVSIVALNMTEEDRNAGI